MPDIYDLGQEFKRELLQKERTAALRLVSAYGTAYARLAKQLDRLLAQIADARAKGETIDAGWLYRQERYFTLLNQIATEMAKFADVAGEIITKEQKAAAKTALDDSAKLMKASAEDLPTIQGTFNRLPVAAVESLAGFLSDGSPLNTLLSQLGPSAQQKVQSLLIEAVANGRGPRDIAREMKKSLGGNLARALAISRTETARAYNEATHRQYQANSDVLEGWEWLATLNGRTCAACIALHGTFHETSERMANHVNCRCAMIPKTIGSPARLEPGAEWFAKQPEKTQRSIFDNDQSFEAYKAGELKLEDFVGRKDSAQWGASYYQLSYKRAAAGEGRFPTSAVTQTRPPQFLVDMIRNAPAYRNEDGIADLDKVAVESLGLSHANPFPPGLQQQTKRAAVGISQVTLGRPALDRERLIRALDAVAGGIKTSGKGIEAILLAERSDGSFVVSGDGNHRVAALKLLGFAGDVPGRVRFQKARRVA
jgi:SPP1 gp7 family putative phage head morphogenesis protein